jgi:glycosyltransferase involved in cell wall biosynthesis
MHLGEQYIDSFLFLFVGKWETRKGLKLLLRAFYREFDEKIDGNSVLVILTSAYHSSSDFKVQIDSFLRTENLSAQSVWGSTVRKPRIVILSRIPQTEIPQLYASVNVLVIPSFGEGWGRPHVESMSSGVPVIATNWSGPTVYMNENNGLPIRVHSFIPAECAY